MAERRIQEMMAGINMAARAGRDDAMRSEALPDIPTVGESVAGYEASFWLGIVVALARRLRQTHCRRDREVGKVRAANIKVE
jgi:hypothetical protein